MSATAWAVYSNAVLEISKKVMDLSADSFFIILATTAYTPAPNTDSTYADISANEVATGLGYTAGGKALTSVTDTLTTATVTFTSADATWASFSAVFRYVAILRCANAATLQSTDKLLCYSDATGSGSITGGGGTLTISMNASGIFTITHSP